MMVRASALHGTLKPSQMRSDVAVVVLGTGLKECIISGLLSVDGLKVRWARTPDLDPIA